MTEVRYVDIAAQHAPLKEELLEAVARVLDHGKFILGPEVEEFEARFAELAGTRFAIGVASGTDALVLALRALDIGPGDEVITAPNSFVASAAAIALVGARPVFVDVRDDLNIDPDAVSAAVTDRTRAILPVHLTGRPAAMSPIMEIASRHGIAVVEDCAQAVLAEVDGRRVGSFGDVGCFSLHPLKTLNAVGDAGVLTTNDEAMARRLRLFRNIGLETRD
ncbi:MAG: DegT/DnrJ/EryC1/StrS family aminotransferase, partial [Actinobacteria bacterium]|nr:DegT/DnrJ/EryC1/StrS family aminotransferase [Actinomycetota bacterium]